MSHYPTEEMKRVLAVKIGLTPNQVNVRGVVTLLLLLIHFTCFIVGWICWLMSPAACWCRLLLLARVCRAGLLRLFCCDAGAWLPLLW